MISALQNGVLGMERASKMVDNAASDFANLATPTKPKTSSSSPPNAVPDGDISHSAINMIIGHRTYDANAKVVEVAARMVDEIV